ncbi:DUF6363 domain-containing protein, partial [Streptococcus suis]
PHQALQIGRLEKNPEKFEEIYQAGLQDGMGVIEDLKGYLEK